MINPYKVLGVHRASSQEEIKAKYYDLMKMSHPDVTTGSIPGLAPPPEEIIAAYQILKDKKFTQRHLTELQILYNLCPVCVGKGYRFKQKGLTERILTPCGQCDGQGYLERG